MIAESAAVLAGAPFAFNACAAHPVEVPPHLPFTVDIAVVWLFTFDIDVWWLWGEEHTLLSLDRCALSGVHSMSWSVDIVIVVLLSATAIITHIVLMRVCVLCCV